MTYETRKISFKNREGHLIAGKLEVPDHEVKGYAIFAHCFTCSKDVFAASRISRALTDEGIAVLRFDFTGLGNSEGDFSNSNFSTNKEDLLHAYEYLKAEAMAPFMLIGHSLGGAAVLATAASLPKLSAVVTIGAPSDVPHIENLFRAEVPVIEKVGEAEVSLAGRKFILKRQFLEDVRSIELETSFENFSQDLLIFHSPEDEVVSFDHAQEIFSRVGRRASFVSLPGADHLLSQKIDSEYVADVISVWCRRYLPEDFYSSGK